MSATTPQSGSLTPEQYRRLQQLAVKTPKPRKWSWVTDEDWQDIRQEAFRRCVEPDTRPQCKRRPIDAPPPPAHAKCLQATGKQWDPLLYFWRARLTEAQKKFKRDRQQTASNNRLGECQPAPDNPLTAAQFDQLISRRLLGEKDCQIAERMLMHGETSASAIARSLNMDRHKVADRIRHIHEVITPDTSAPAPGKGSPKDAPYDRWPKEPAAESAEFKHDDELHRYEMNRVVNSVVTPPATPEERQREHALMRKIEQRGEDWEDSAYRAWLVKQLRTVNHGRDLRYVSIGLLERLVAEHKSNCDLHAYHNAIIVKRRQARRSGTTKRRKPTLPTTQLTPKIKPSQPAPADIDDESLRRQLGPVCAVAGLDLEKVLVMFKDAANDPGPGSGQRVA